MSHVTWVTQVFLVFWRDIRHATIKNYFTNLIYQFGLQKLWDFKVDCLGHNLYLFCTMSTCLSFFRNLSHANYLGKYTKWKNLILVNRSFHESTFIWDSFGSNRYFLRTFKYFVLTLQFYTLMNVVTWVTWNCPSASGGISIYDSGLRFSYKRTLFYNDFRWTFRYNYSVNKYFLPFEQFFSQGNVQFQYFNQSATGRMYCWKNFPSVYHNFGVNFPSPYVNCVPPLIYWSLISILIAWFWWACFATVLVTTSSSSR